ncbi:vascular cell adhesion protein 1-like [Mobula birostris]|uniref:vascular cell adhesion protein 1-like n=1 Tax=Mobula birostris TaxID=1983395 RepID=UPI003B27E065
MGYTQISAGGYVLFLTALSVITGKLNGFEVSVKPNSPVVEFGHSLEVTCSTTCNNPSIILEYKPGVKPIRTHGDKWITDRFPSVQKWDLTVPCTVICPSAEKKIKESKRVVPVYNREIRVFPPPKVLEVNKPYQLECIGPKVYPKNKLVLTWLRGSETIANISTEEPGFPEDGPLKNVLHFNPNISDDGLVYTCLAELILHSNARKSVTNASVTLRTYSFPELPRILSRDPVEVNQEVTLTCEVPNVYPAEKMRLRWFWGGERQNSVTNRSDATTVRATTTWTPRKTGLTEVSCTADFEDYPSIPLKDDSISIEVYIFSNPEIQILITTEGIPVNITCSVFNVSGELQLRLKKGSEILVNRSASTGLTIYHTVNPRAELNGQQFTCEAELTLQHHPNTIVKRQSATLTVHDKLNGFEVSIKANPPVVEFGHSLEVTCSTTCNNPVTILEYKPGINPNRTCGDKWITDQFPSVQTWDFTVPCTVICGSENHEVKEDKWVVPVYNRNLSIVPSPDVLEVNKPYQLECTGPKVYPKNKLVLTWLRENETIANISTENPGFPEDGPLKNVLHFNASISDDGMVYTCLAELNLDSNTTKQIANASMTLQIYSFPEPPRILSRDLVEVNQEVTLTCEVPNVYPAEKVRVRWFCDGEQQNSATYQSNSTTVRATTTWTPRETGLTEVSCTADFEDYPSIPLKNDSISIEVYAFSNPQIHIPITTEGIPVIIICSVFNVSGELQLRLKKGSEILVNRSASTGLTIYHTVNPRAELNGQQFTCEAELTLQHHSNAIVKRQSTTLTVHDSPGSVAWIIPVVLFLGIVGIPLALTLIKKCRHRRL